MKTILIYPHKFHKSNQIEAAYAISEQYNAEVDFVLPDKHVDEIKIDEIDRFLKELETAYPAEEYTKYFVAVGFSPLVAVIYYLIKTDMLNYDCVYFTYENSRYTQVVI